MSPVEPVEQSNVKLVAETAEHAIQQSLMTMTDVQFFVCAYIVAALATLIIVRYKTNIGLKMLFWPLTFLALICIVIKEETIRLLKNF